MFYKIYKKIIKKKIENKDKYNSLNQDSPNNTFISNLEYPNEKNNFNYIKLDLYELSNKQKKLDFIDNKIK